MKCINKLLIAWRKMVRSNKTIAINMLTKTKRIPLSCLISRWSMIRNGRGVRDGNDKIMRTSLGDTKRRGRGGTRRK